MAYSYTRRTKIRYLVEVKHPSDKDWKPILKAKHRPNGEVTYKERRFKDRDKATRYMYRQAQLFPEAEFRLVYETAYVHGTVVSNAYRWTGSQT